MVAAPAADNVRQKLAVGQKLETGDQGPRGAAGRRPPVYLNRNTAVTYECRGELTLNRGEIYVERWFSPPRYATNKSAEETLPPASSSICPRARW